MTKVPKLIKAVVDFSRKMPEQLFASAHAVWTGLNGNVNFTNLPVDLNVFKVKLDAPFAAGQISRGQITYPGYEHITWEAFVEKIEPEHHFSFTWPHVRSFEKADKPADYTGAPSTLVEFRLEPISGDTLLILTESGFDSVPADWRPEAFRRNDGGWTEQMKNIESHVTQNP